MNYAFLTPLLLGITAVPIMAQDTPHQDSSTVASAAAKARSAARCKASQLIGCAITNSKDESLGEIHDIVLDSRNGRIAYAVVAFGGFLGMGEKFFAMPWRLIQVEQRSAEDSPRATLGLEQAALKSAPGFDKSKWPDMANPTWATQVDEYYASRSEPARPDGATEPKGSGVDGTRGVDREPASKPFVHRRLGKLIGMEVVDPQHKHLGNVEDLVVDTNTAKVDGALVSFGGTLGIGEKLVLVPTASLNLDHEKEQLVMACSKARFEAMALPEGKLPPLNGEDWLVRCREQCLKASEEVVAMDSDRPVVDASGTRSMPFADVYDVAHVESLKGTITTIGSVRIGDQKEERVRLRVRTTDGREVIVYAAPKTCADQEALALRKGSVVEIVGSPAMYGTQSVLIAGSIAVDGKSAVLRDAKGQPTWTK